jgi:hypothetical protein
MNTKFRILTSRLPSGAVATFSALLVAGTLGAGEAQAASIAVSNANFEEPGLVTGGFTLVSPPGWSDFLSAAGGLRGVFNPFNSQLTTPTNGSQVGFISINAGAGVGIQQTLVDTLALGSYTLQADFAYRKDCCRTPDFALELLAGGNVLATFTGTSAAFDNLNFKTATVNFEATPGSANLGQALGIRIRSAGFTVQGIQFNFDNVRLNVTPAPVPLPLPALLLGSALTGLGAFRRRNR